MEPGMDCQTCNDLLLDLAYGELDEVRAAAARKHLDACAECRDAFGRISRGRALARRLAPAEPPAISMTLRAAMEAQAARFAEASASASGAPVPDANEDERASNVVPIAARDGRLSRWFERVGELAMRRQVAMAAVFLLMIGVGLIFYQSHPRPTDAQDDRVPDVVPAVEVTASPANSQTAENRARLATAGSQRAPEHEEPRYRAYANPSTASANARTDPALQRERLQQAQGRAGGAANAEVQNSDLDTLHEMQAAAPTALTAPAPTVAPMPSPVAPSMHASTQFAQQSAPVAPSQVALRQANVEQTLAANTAAAARPTNDLIVRLQSELASAPDEASRARIRSQLIAAYESNAMYAEANALRAQSAEPAAAASNSISNVAAAPAGAGQSQQAGGVAATASAGSTPESATGSSAGQSATSRVRSRRTTTVRRASPARAAPADSYMETAY